MNNEFYDIIKKPTFRAALHKGLNFILSGKLRALEGVSIIQLFRINDIAPLIYSTKSNVKLRSSFPSYEYLRLWAKSNNLVKKDLMIYRENPDGSVVNIGCQYHAFFGEIYGISLLFCRQDATQKEYSKICMQYYHDILNQYYKTQNDIISFYKSWEAIISSVKSIYDKGLTSYINEKYPTKNLIKDLDYLQNYFSCQESASKEGLKILDAIVDIDHLKYKKSCRKDEWILMMPCYSWVNRRVGHKLEIKLKNNKLLLTDIGPFNGLELIKLFSSFYPENKEHASMIAEDISNICATNNPDPEIKRLIKGEIESIFSQL